jgi:heat shock protein HslJ
MMKMIAVFGWVILLAVFLVSCVTGEKGGVRTEAGDIEGPKWFLTEVCGAPVSPLAGEKQPHILFDPAKKKVTGFAGCNQFFGSYELDGASLKFGPVGSTRMACPDLQMSLETEVLKALDQTRAWEIRDGRLLLLDDRNVLARFTVDGGGT